MKRFSITIASILFFLVSVGGVHGASFEISGGIDVFGMTTNTAQIVSGTKTFTANQIFNDAVQLIFGTDSDISLEWDGSNLLITDDSETLAIGKTGSNTLTLEAALGQFQLKAPAIVFETDNETLSWDGGILAGGILSGKPLALSGSTHGTKGDVVIHSTSYLRFDKTNAGAPSAGDCDDDGDRGRLVIDTTNNAFYVCNGGVRAWDSIVLNDGAKMDWDDVWTDAVHSHASDGEGGSNIGPVTITTNATVAVIHGTTVSGGDLTLSSTSDATKGTIYLGSASQSGYDEVNNRLGIGTTAPDSPIHVKVGDAGLAASALSALSIEQTGAVIGYSILTDNDQSGYIFFGDPQSNISGQFRYGHSDNVFEFTTDGTSRMKLDADSNLRLGTPSIGSGDPTHHLVLQQGTEGTTPATDTGWLFNKDFTGTSKPTAEDDAGGQAALTPHIPNHMDKVDEVAAAAGLPLHPYPWTPTFINKATGVEHWVDMAHLVWAVEQLAGQAGLAVTKFNYLEELSPEERFDWDEAQESISAERRARIDRQIARKIKWEKNHPDKPFIEKMLRPYKKKKMPAWMVRRLGN